MRDTIVIGASAGGVDALTRLVSQFPADLPAAVLAVIHLSAHAPSSLPEILTRKGRLKARGPFPGDGEMLVSSRIYCAIPDHHLQLDGERALALRGPRVNGHRPAIDVLFRSSARARGDRVIGVVLTGCLDDGVGGLREIRRRGGVAVVQRPGDALHPELPENAIAGAGADHVVALSEMGALLLRLLLDRSTPEGGNSPPGKGESGGRRGTIMPSRTSGPTQDWSSSTESPEGGAPSVYSCPECHGVLWNTGPDDLPRFVCRVGHAYDPESLLAEQQAASEKLMWAAFRSLEERASLARKLLKRARALGQSAGEERFAKHLDDVEQQVAPFRSALQPGGGSTPASSSRAPLDEMP